MLDDALAALRLFLVTIVLCAISYPLILLGLGKAFFHDQAEGGLVEVNGQVVGSRLVAQDFTEDRYLWPRPSAADYDATAASGSNLAASNPALRTRIVHELGVLHASDDERVPADLVTASGSGLDPHVTLAGALYQAPRIAAARGVEAARVRAILEDVATPRSPGGPPLVNALEANLRLDRELPVQQTP